MMAHVLSKHLAATNCTSIISRVSKRGMDSKRGICQSACWHSWDFAMGSSYLGTLCKNETRHSSKMPEAKPNSRKTCPHSIIACSFQVSHLHRFGIALWQVTGEEIGPGWGIRSWQLINLSGDGSSLLNHSIFHTPTSDELYIKLLSAVINQILSTSKSKSRHQLPRPQTIANQVPQLVGMFSLGCGGYPFAHFCSKLQKVPWKILLLLLLIIISIIVKVGIVGISISIIDHPPLRDLAQDSQRGLAPSRRWQSVAATCTIGDLKKAAITRDQNKSSIPPKRPEHLQSVDRNRPTIRNKQIGKWSSSALWARG